MLQVVYMLCAYCTGVGYSVGAIAYTILHESVPSGDHNVRMAYRLSGEHMERHYVMDFRNIDNVCLVQKQQIVIHYVGGLYECTYRRWPGEECQ